MAQTTSIGFDRIDGFEFGTDLIDLPGTQDSYEVVNGGTLNDISFDADLTAALSGSMSVNEANLFTASTGDMAGRLFLVVDANGQAGYQGGQDFVIVLVNTAVPGTIPDFLV